MAETIVYKGCINREIQLENGTRTARKTLLFFCPRDTILSSVLEDEHVPQEGDVFEEDSELYCQSIHLKTERSGNGKVSVECIYDKKTERLPELSSGVNLDKQPAFNVSVRSAERAVPFEYAYQESDTYLNPTVPVVTSSGIPIHATSVSVSLILNFSYYSSRFTPENILSYCGTIKKSAETVCGITIPAKCALLRKLSSSIVQTRGKKVSRVDVELEIRPEGFQRIFADRSTSVLDGTGRPVRLYSKYSSTTGTITYGTWYQMWSDGSAFSPVVSVDEPLPLNGQGALAAAGSSPAKLSFQEKYAAVWTTLKFPKKANW